MCNPGSGPLEWCLFGDNLFRHHLLRTRKPHSSPKSHHVQLSHSPRLQWDAYEWGEGASVCVHLM